ncbi:hypothetical protein KUTeg_007855 [Tegillarca granosa]|uniref:Uncharacterized protein n=1 Tax=Tegillarca granosa TaxID=220873 RepID=A0ABQ9FJ53_TEGGR|nr:hypothetical protein KUTeg_007855 [Tegillarca granosa]
MGKKKGKKGGKKGKGKKGGKKKEAQMTAQEAILAYQIGIVEKKLEDVMYEIRELKTKIAKTEEEIAAVKKDLDYWTEYKNKGQHEHKKHIQIVKDDMTDMENSFEDMKGRPQSATQRYVENKVFNIVRASLEMEDLDEGDESDDESADTELLDNMFFEEEDFSVSEQMPIHAPPELSREEVQAKDCQPDNWPVTQPMLQAVAKTK